MQIVPHCCCSLQRSTLARHKMAQKTHTMMYLVRPKIRNEHFLVLSVLKTQRSRVFRTTFSLVSLA